MGNGTWFFIFAFACGILGFICSDAVSVKWSQIICLGTVVIVLSIIVLI